MKAILVTNRKESPRGQRNIKEKNLNQLKSRIYVSFNI